MLTTQQKVKNLNSSMLSWTFICLIVSLVLAALSYGKLAFLLAHLALVTYLLSKGARLYEVCFYMSGSGIVSRFYLFVVNLLLIAAALYVWKNVFF